MKTESEISLGTRLWFCCSCIFHCKNVKLKCLPKEGEVKLNYEACW